MLCTDLGGTLSWDRESHHEVHTFPSLSYTTDVAFSPDGRYLAAGTIDPLASLRAWPSRLVRQDNRFDRLGRIPFQAIIHKDECWLIEAK